MWLCNEAVQIDTGQKAAMLYGNEGNHGSDIAPAMHHRLNWFIHNWTQGLNKIDELHSSQVIWHLFTTVIYICEHRLHTLTAVPRHSVGKIDLVTAVTVSVSASPNTVSAFIK